MSGNELQGIKMNRPLPHPSESLISIGKEKDVCIFIMIYIKYYC